VDTAQRFSHVRLRIYPDGGVARLRVHGEPLADPDLLAALGTFDLAALEHGAAVVAASNAFYSTPSNLIAPGHARTMGEGWETARRRDDGNDWVVVRLAGAGVVRVAEIDTSWFLGNAPGWASLSACTLDDGERLDGVAWRPLLERRPLRPDTRHRVVLETAATAAATHVRLDVFPDGGMARLRLWGSLSESGTAEVRRRWAATA
jgi:allantoicase